MTLIYSQRLGPFLVVMCPKCAPDQVRTGSSPCHDAAGARRLAPSPRASTQARDVIYIGLVLIDPSVEAKINEKHNVTPDEVREAIQWPARARAVWEDHPDHGLRVIAVGTTWTGRTLMAVLQPVHEADGTWRLRSARARND